jgi:hypothetical protein
VHVQQPQNVLSTPTVQLMPQFPNTPVILPPSSLPLPANLNLESLQFGSLNQSFEALAMDANKP